MQNARSVWGPQSRQYAACAEMALSYRSEMELGLELVGSVSGNGKEKLAADGGSEVGSITGGGIEKAFRGLNIGNREGA